MTDDFSDFRDDTFDDSPDWLLDEGGASDEMDDGFEQLRQKSTRTGSMYDDMESSEEVRTSSSSSFSWSSFSSGQRLVLALLIVLDILAVAFGVMVIANII
ncbi:MAG: hypothetical protein R6X34_11880 [Chloroflexota bacterium]